MNSFISKVTLILAFLMITQHINAQNYNDYRDVEAVMLQVNGNVYSEKKLEGAIVALPDNSNQLILRLYIPFSSINENAAEDTVPYIPDYHLHLRVRIDCWKIQ